MPEEEKKKPLDKMVELDTSGPEVDVTIEEPKVKRLLKQKKKNQRSRK
jgi:hypothetical protein